MNPSLKPYFIRAIHEWCCDKQFTPHIIVFVNEYTDVPREFVKNNEIILNIGHNAVSHLVIGNDWVRFTARFSGKIENIRIPTGHIVGIFSKESGEGMTFDLHIYDDSKHQVAETTDNHDKPVAEKTHLKVIKKSTKPKK